MAKQRTQADESHRRYWTHVHPYCSILDSRLHTPSFVRSRSAFLFTVILASAASVLASLSLSNEALVNEAMALYSHVEKLNSVVQSAGAKSIEVVQAMIVRTLLCMLLTLAKSPDRRSGRTTTYLLGRSLMMTAGYGLQPSSVWRLRLVYICPVNTPVPTPHRKDTSN